MAKAKPNGYHWNQEITRARNANQEIRQILTRIIETEPGPNTLNLLITRLALAVGENDHAINEIDRISKN